MEIPDPYQFKWTQKYTISNVHYCKPVYVYTQDEYAQYLIDQKIESEIKNGNLSSANEVINAIKRKLSNS